MIVRWRITNNLNQLVLVPNGLYKLKSEIMRTAEVFCRGLFRGTFISTNGTDVSDVSDCSTNGAGLLCSSTASMAHCRDLCRDDSWLDVSLSMNLVTNWPSTLEPWYSCEAHRRRGQRARCSAFYKVRRKPAHTGRERERESMMLLLQNNNNRKTHVKWKTAAIKTGYSIIRTHTLFSTAHPNSKVGQDNCRSFYQTLSKRSLLHATGWCSNS